MGVVDRVHVVMLGSRVGWIVGVDGGLVDGDLGIDVYGLVDLGIDVYGLVDGERDIDVHGGVGGVTGFHGRVLDHEVRVGGVDFIVVECVGVSDESALSDPTCGCC